MFANIISRYLSRQLFDCAAHMNVMKPDTQMTFTAQFIQYRLRPNNINLLKSVNDRNILDNYPVANGRHCKSAREQRK